MRHSISNSWIARGVVTAATASLMVAGAAPAFADDAPKAPKNVIVMIGDGMGYNHVDHAALYAGGVAAHQVRSSANGVVPVKGTPYFEWQKWDNVGMSTYSVAGSYDPAATWANFDHVKSGATDSAAAATAMATGVKTYNGGIGVDPDGNMPENLTERAIKLGKAAGVVSSVPFTHATPAGYASHTTSRSDLVGIGTQMIDSDLSLILSPAHPFYDNSGKLRQTPNYRYLGENDYNRLVDGQTDWAFIEETADFKALTTGDAPEKLFGLVKAGTTLNQGRAAAGEEKMPYDTPLNDVPTLEDLTKVALNVLDEDEDGFFVMIEGGAIDWAGHANQSVRQIEETLDFDAAVNAAIDWVEQNSSWDETMIIVTADHETGYLAGPDSGGTTWTPMTGAKGSMPDMGWYSGDHTNQLVPMYARGAGLDTLMKYATGSDPVRGAYLDNTALAKFLLDELWVVQPETGDIPVTAVIDEEGTQGEDPGSLVLSIAEGGVTLDGARNVGDRLRLTGALPGVSVTDTRDDAEGWSVTGQASDLKSENATVRAANLGWAPFISAGKAVLGADVATLLAGGPGLAAPATLGSSAEGATGTTTLAADMRLEVPVDTKAGSYNGGITVSLFAQD